MSRTPAALLLLVLVAAACTGADPSPVSVSLPPTATPIPSRSAPPLPTAQPSPRLTETPTATPATPTPATPATPTTAPTSGFDPERAGLTFEPFASGLDTPTFLTHAPDGSGQLYVLEQAGVIQVLDADGSLRPSPLLDISDRVRAGGERGLLGLAFHPDYSTTGRFFINYTDRAGDTVVAEFARSEQGTAAVDSGRVLLTIEQPFGNHNGGMLEFGPDGYLYIATGDGGSAGDPLGSGQDLGSLLGAILRIDVDGGEPYAIPPDNAFAADPAARPEIWSWGLRNPWRFSFDRQSGALFIADVGQRRWEEINVAPAGEGGRNYGWNIMEGPECFRARECETAGLTMPVAWYARDAGQCAIVGGYVYRGSSSPALVGAYVFSDFCSGVVWAIDSAAALGGEEVAIHELGSAGLRPSSFGVDEAGELYLVGHGGDILRLVTREP